MSMVVWFCLVLCSPCFQVNEIKVVDATRVKFEGGREESGSGVQYEIWIKTHKNSRKLKIQYVWVDGNNYTPLITVNENFQGKNEFHKGDTLLLSFTKWIHKPESNEKTDIESPKTETPPGKYMGEGIIEGKIKGKTFYTQIDRFRELKPKEYK